MKHTTPQSLLSLPPEMQIPEAYRVLGLAAFESDKAKIKAAAEAILVRLKDAKETADKAAWEKSIVWVKNAQAILGDSGKKAAYDRKLAADSAAKPPATDPLSGMLPGAGAPTTGRVQTPAIPPPFRPGQVPRPAAPAVPVYDPLAGALPTGAVRGTPAGAVTSQPLETAPSVPVFRGRSSTKRRRGLPWIPILLSLFCVIAIAALGGIVWLVQTGNPIVINTSGGPLITSPDGSGQVVGQPMELHPRPVDVPVTRALGEDAAGKDSQLDAAVKTLGLGGH